MDKFDSIRGAEALRLDHLFVKGDRNAVQFRPNERAGDFGPRVSHTGHEDTPGLGKGGRKSPTRMEPNASPPNVSGTASATPRTTVLR